MYACLHPFSRYVYWFLWLILLFDDAMLIFYVL